MAQANRAPVRRSSKAPAKRPAGPRPAPNSGDLPGLVRAWREAPSPVRRAAVEAYATAHAKETNGALARLALGVGDYEHWDYPAAVRDLKDVAAKLPQVADYAGYYLAAARLELKDTAGLDADLAPAHAGDARSPVAGRAWLVEAKSLTATQPSAAIKLLRDHFGELPQPEGNQALAEAYQANNDLPRAVEFYQRVYYEYVNGDSVAKASAALAVLKEQMGASYPAPLGAQKLRRAGKFLDAREYAKARSEYESILDSLEGVERDQARVRIGTADYMAGKTAPACAYFKDLTLSPSEADAERLFQLEECSRRQNDQSAAMDAVSKLNNAYPKSPWRLKALIGAANPYLVTNRTSDYLPLYEAVRQDFPGDPSTGLYSWRVAFRAYFQGAPNAAELMREHLRQHPRHSTAGDALYFLGRQAEQTNDMASARAYYQRLAQAFPNYYFGMQARERLQKPEVAAATASPSVLQFVNGLKLPENRPAGFEATRPTTAHIERSRLLRAAGLTDLADAELRFGARTDGQPALLGMEMASATDAPHQALHLMKSMAGDYLGIGLDQAPRKFWEILFPLPYRNELTQYAQQHNIDPFLLAGLIRQESEFDPGARSPANAYGLTQVLPVTGRQYARKMGIPRFTNGLLFQPSINLQIGSSIFRSMLDANGGRLEETLAAYNAGPGRLATWLSWNNCREPAEFVEMIPFTETRDYVQGVLRNADIYRRLYR